MKNLLEFNPTRFWHLLKLEFTTKNQRALYVLVAVLSIMMGVQLIMAWDGDNDAYTFFQGMYPFLLMAGGLIYTSYSFKEFSETATSMTYLTLPASNFEKLTSKWLFSTIGFYLVYLISFNVFIWIGHALSNALFDVPINGIYPFEGENWVVTKVYFVVSSLFFLGAIAFKSYHAPKTVLSLIGLGLVIAFLTLLIVRIVFFDFFDGFQPIQHSGMMISPGDGMEEFVTGPLATFGKYLFWIGMPLLFWAVSFFKLKERQIG